MTHKDLEVWKLSIGFVTNIYKTCKQLPDSEKFGLISQMQRAAVSIPTNIAEGAARKNTKKYIQFLYSIRFFFGSGYTDSNSKKYLRD